MIQFLFSKKAFQLLLSLSQATRITLSSLSTESAIKRGGSQ